MKLFVRIKPKGVWINFLHNIQEFREFEDMFIEGRPLMIGDLSTFSRPMMNRLLKFIEEHPEVDCYTSRDLTDAILLSRFVEINKEPLVISQGQSFEDFYQSNNDYMSVVSNLSSLSTDIQLRVPMIKNSAMKLIEKL